MANRSRKSPPNAADRPILVEGCIKIGGRELNFPDIAFLHEIAAGANGVVFAAHDNLLDRRIAVKIWNARGAPRSQRESQKIANIKHPLFVTTHRFGRSDAGDPFAIMEFVDGESAKTWLEKNPRLEERIADWRSYSIALEYLYSKDMLHGDAHLGNVLVYYPYESSEYSRSLGGVRNGIEVKVADTGTSVVWSSRRDFATRESKLIAETASRLFRDQGIDKILKVPKPVGCRALIQAIGAFSSVVSFLNTIDQDRRSLTASQVANYVFVTPVFDLDELLNYVAMSPGTTRNRLINRLNERLDRKPTDEEHWPDALTDKARASYEERRQWYLTLLKNTHFAFTPYQTMVEQGRVSR